MSIEVRTARARRARRRRRADRARVRRGPVRSDHGPGPPAAAARRRGPGSRGRPARRRRRRPAARHGRACCAPARATPRQARADEAEVRLLTTAPEARGLGRRRRADGRVDRPGPRLGRRGAGPRHRAAERRVAAALPPPRVRAAGRARDQSSPTGLGRLAVFRYDFSRTGRAASASSRRTSTTRVAQLSVEAYAHDYDLRDEYRASLADVATRAREHEVWVARGPRDRRAARHGRHPAARASTSRRSARTASSTSGCSRSPRRPAGAASARCSPSTSSPWPGSAASTGSS